MFKKETTGRMQNIKEKMFSLVKNNKKKTIAALAFLTFGGFLGNSSRITQEEYDLNEAKIIAITQEIAECGSQHNEILEEISVLTTKKEELTEKITALNSEKSSLTANVKTEETRIASEEKAKEEAERIAAEQAAKAEAERIAAEQAEAERIAAANANNYVGSSAGNTVSAAVNEDNIGEMVWITATGKKYHSHNNCGNSQHVSQVTRSQAEARGLGPCSKCY